MDSLMKVNDPDGKKPTFLKWIAVFNGSQPPVGKISASNTVSLNTQIMGPAQHGDIIIRNLQQALGLHNIGTYTCISTEYFRSNCLSEFSSFGGTPIIFESDGQRKQEYEYRPQPRFIAPQNGDTNFLPQMVTHHWKRYAYPKLLRVHLPLHHVAAVAALCLHLMGNLHLQKSTSILPTLQ